MPVKPEKVLKKIKTQLHNPDPMVNLIIILWFLFDQFLYLIIKSLSNNKAEYSKSD